MAPSPHYRRGTLVYTTRGLAVLFFWLLWGDFCFTFMENVVPTIMPLKLKALGASNTAIGLIIVIIPNVINTVANPFISFRSDRFRSRWGRRIPFIIFSLPFLVLGIVAFGFGDAIGAVFHRVAGTAAGHLSPGVAAIGVFGAIMVFFSFFNTFVNSTFWYLFNDVIPEHLLARFMSWFRLVSLISVCLYDYFIFPYANSHFREIFLGTAILYLVGFGLMCLKVKEGGYPPPPENIGGRTDLWAAIATFFRECFSLGHYWWIFLGDFSIAAFSSTLPLMVFFYQGTGMNLNQIGKIQAALTISTALSVLGAGWLADRYHPIRVVLVGQVLQIVLALPATGVWLFWHPAPAVAYGAWMAMSIVLAGPMMASIAMSDPPLLMRIFPRERYGQFCAANSICKSIGLALGGFLAGLFLDLLSRDGSHADVYTYLPLIQIFFAAPSLFYFLKLYRSWKSYGGDSRYVAPV